MACLSKLKNILCCVAAVLALAGCDWVKGRLGMPTSEDIAIMKEQLEAREALEQMRLQEEARMKFVEDSLAQVEAAGQKQKIEGYHVIIGAFKDYSNAESLEKFVKGLGYEPMKIMLKNGYMMVSVGGYSTVEEAVAQIRKIESLEVCPYDVWVYPAHKGLHVED